MPIKTDINNNGSNPIGYKRREVWLCNLGENIGFEEDGKGDRFVRPVLILKIYSRRFCHILPLSTTDKRGKFYYEFNAGTEKTSVALLSQSRSIDSYRLIRKIGIANNADFKAIMRQVVNLLIDS